MQRYTNNDPQFSDSIMEPSFADPAHPNIFNPAYEQLLDNTLVLKRKQRLAEEETVKQIAEDCLKGTGIAVEGAAVIGLPEESRVATAAEVKGIMQRVGKILDD